MKKKIFFYCCLLFLFISCTEEHIYNYNVILGNEIPPGGVNVSSFGFFPENTASENVKALREALDSAQVVYVDQPGVYDLDDVIKLKDGSKLFFGENVYIRKQRNKDGISPEYVFINEGAYTRTCNRGIEIHGLNLICNGLDDNHSKIQGLVGHVSFFHVKDLILKNFRCVDMLKSRFCIQIAEFENIQIENAHIEGDKDGIHLGAGKKFTIRNCVFSTLDDPIALNAHDYDISNPTVGWIEDGLIENCYDMPHPSKGYHFCRILGGSWVDWFEGMKLQKSDIVVNEGRLYRVIANPDGKEYTSYTPPTHTSGYQELDGINWYMMQENVVYNAGCRNVHFKNIHLKRDRSSTFEFHFDMDRWSRSYYPGSTAPVQENFVFENIYTTGRLGRMITAQTPVDNLYFINSEWNSGNIGADFPEKIVGLDYPAARIYFNNITFNPQGANNLGVTDTGKKRTIQLVIENSTRLNYPKGIALHGNVEVLASDIPYYYLNQ